MTDLASLIRRLESETEGSRIAIAKALAAKERI